jgi:hypothetical protein
LSKTTYSAATPQREQQEALGVEVHLAGFESAKKRRVFHEPEGKPKT